MAKTLQELKAEREKWNSKNTKSKLSLDELKKARGYVAPQMKEASTNTSDFRKIEQQSEIRTRQDATDFIKKNNPEANTNKVRTNSPTASNYADIAQQYGTNVNNVVNADIKQVGNALLSGMGQFNTGILKGLSLVEQAVPNLAAKLESVATGKEVDPRSGLFDKLIQNAIISQEQATQPYAEKINNVQGLGKYPLQAIQSLPQMAGAFMGGSEAQVLGMLGASATGQQARQTEKQGGTYGQQLATGLASGGIEAATEILPLSNLMKFKGTGDVSKLVTSIVSESLGESISQAFQPFIESVMNKSAVKEAYTTNIKSTAQQIVDAGITGGLSALLLGGAAMGVNVANTINNPTQENVQQTVSEIEKVSKTPLDRVELAKAIPQLALPSSTNAQVNPLQSISEVNNLSSLSTGVNAQIAELEKLRSKTKSKYKLSDIDNKIADLTAIANDFSQSKGIYSNELENTLSKYQVTLEDRANEIEQMKNYSVDGAVTNVMPKALESEWYNIQNELDTINKFKEANGIKPVVNNVQETIQSAQEPIVTQPTTNVAPKDITLEELKAERKKSFASQPVKNATVNAEVETIQDKKIKEQLLDDADVEAMINNFQKKGGTKKTETKTKAKTETRQEAKSFENLSPIEKANNEIQGEAYSKTLKDFKMDKLSVAAIDDKVNKMTMTEKSLFDNTISSYEKDLTKSIDKRISKIKAEDDIKSAELEKEKRADNFDIPDSELSLDELKYRYGNDIKAKSVYDKLQEKPSTKEVVQKMTKSEGKQSSDSQYASDSDNYNLYHGTWRKHKGFTKDSDFYFTKDKDYATSYIRDTREGTDLGGELLGGKIKENAKILDTTTKEGMEVARKIIAEDEVMSYNGVDAFIRDNFNDGLPMFGKDSFAEEAKRLGYDALAISERDGISSYRLFNPDAIDAKPIKGTQRYITEIAKDVFDKLNPVSNTNAKSTTPNKTTPDAFNLDIEPKLSQEAGYVDLAMFSKGSKKVEEYTGYLDKELEAQHRDAKIKPESSLLKAKEAIKEVKYSFTRSYLKLDPNDSMNAEMIKEMNLYKKAKSKAGDTVTRKLMAILKDLDKNEYDVFSRFVLLRDLSNDIKDNITLPGLYTEANVTEELKNVVEHMNDKIQEAIEKRDAILKDVKDNYIESMKKIGYDASKKLNKEDYFRHIVIEHYQQKSMTNTNSDKVQGKDNRGFTKQRKGTDKLIVEDYLQAEYEILLQLTYDAEVADLLKRVDTNYGIKDKLAIQAKKANKIIRDTNEELTVKKVDGDTALEDRYKKINQVIGMSFSNMADYAKNGLLDDYSTGENLSALIKGQNAEIFPILNKILLDETLDGSEDISITAKTIYKYLNMKKDFQREVLGNAYTEANKTWKDFIPDGYTTFQPIDGKRVITVNTVSNTLADAILTNDLEGLNISKEKVQQMLAIAGNKLEFVLPDNISGTLNDVYDSMNKSTGVIEKVIKNSLSLWKRWVLTGNPRSVVKYNIRNISGDLEGLIDSNGVKALAYTKKASTDLYNALAKGNFTKDMKEWYDRGGYQDLLYANEIQEVNNMKMFKNFKHIDETNLLSKMRNRIPGIKNYFDFTEGITNYRESILRYSAYMYYKAELNRSNGKVKNYGTSKRAIIDGLKTTEDKAYQLSKDALGAYDEISHAGKKLREYLIPFWSWNEVNFKRYKNMISNDLYDIKVTAELGHKFGKSLGMTGKITGKTAFTLGKIAFKIGILNAVMTAWNNFVHPDEEKDLPIDVQKIPHIVFGRDSKGDVVYFSRLGASTDIMEWFGLDTLWTDIQEISEDKKSLGEQAEDMIYSPINKLINSISPFIKIPIELIMKKSIYPDVRKGSAIRDVGEYFANTFGLREEYSRIVGFPEKETYFESWAKAFVYKSDPAVSAYYDTLDRKYQFREKILGEKSSIAFSDSEKSKALYYVKQAVRYGDSVAARKYLTEYLKFGGTEKGLKLSLTHLDPLYGLDEEQTIAFYYWLDEKEREKLIKAVDYYNSLLK